MPKKKCAGTAEGFRPVSTLSHARHNGVSGVAVVVETI